MLVGTGFCLLGLFAISGCTPASSGQHTAAAAPAAASFDGRYQGSVKLTGSASGVDPRLCETEDQVSLEVEGGKFTYAQPHPNAVGPKQGLSEHGRTPVYDVTIAPNGTITGVSHNGGGTLKGQMNGSRMNVQINGLLCFYSLTAVRAAASSGNGGRNAWLLDMAAASRGVGEGGAS